ncbi:LOW QUALITY PROTEIN: uncharacterized protein Dyak_GE29192 [Drosophila yakuba]|uniref:Uncharacterized protein n=1 Tax=Drosophila yakuba TaxID=7245 RepID=A0A0R1DXZ6_DROYA|nr:LOW QUALITY PROTEIN: uncharacterized protein Dyak_GE29192 [Drosophila yakuba]
MLYNLHTISGKSRFYKELAARLETDLTAVLSRLEAANNLKLAEVTIPPVERITLQVDTSLQMEFNLPEKNFIRKDITSLVKQRGIDYLLDQVITIAMNLAVLYRHAVGK